MNYVDWQKKSLERALSMAPRRTVFSARWASPACRRLCVLSRLKFHSYLHFETIKKSLAFFKRRNRVHFMLTLETFQHFNSSGTLHFETERSQDGVKAVHCWQVTAVCGRKRPALTLRPSPEVRVAQWYTSTLFYRRHLRNKGAKHSLFKLVLNKSKFGNYVFLWGSKWRQQRILNVGGVLTPQKLQMSFSGEAFWKQ